VSSRRLSTAPHGPVLVASAEWLNNATTDSVAVEIERHGWRKPAREGIGMGKETGTGGGAPFDGVPSGEASLGGSAHVCD
jgi:hypothetical protein